MNNNPHNNKRRSFIKSGLGLGLLGFAAPQYSLAQLATRQEAFKIISPPCLQSSFNNSMTVLWVVNKNAASWVEYGFSPDNLEFKAYGQSELGLRPIGTINVVRLANLKPGVTYYYRVVSKEIKDFKPYKLSYGEQIQSDTLSFVNTDPNQDEIRFLMMNDVHDRPKTIPFLMDLNQGKAYDFVFFNGDIFDYQTDENQLIRNFFEPCATSFAQNKAFVYVRGNHETRGKYCRQFPQYFDGVGYRAFSLGQTRFVIIDTGEDKADQHPVYANIVDFFAYREEQANLFRAEMQSKAFKKAKYRIVMMHIPPIFGGDAPGEKHVNELFHPLLNQAKVDLVLSGHTHRYKVHLPNKTANQYPLFIGGGPKEGTRTLTQISINNKTLSVNMLNDQGQQVGSYTTSKG